VTRLAKSFSPPLAPDVIVEFGIRKVVLSFSVFVLAMLQSPSSTGAPRRYTPAAGSLLHQQL
jgi:hypothetical protein